MVEKNHGFTGKRGLCFKKICVFLMIRDSRPAPTLNEGTTYPVNLVNPIYFWDDFTAEQLPIGINIYVPMFNTTLTNEFLQIARTFDLGLEVIEQLVLNSGNRSGVVLQCSTQ